MNTRDLIWSRSRLKGMAKFIAISIAEWCDQEGRSRISLSGLQVMTNMTRKTISMNLNVIEKSGEISRISGKGSKTNNEYRVNVELLASFPDRIGHSRAFEARVINTLDPRVENTLAQKYARVKSTHSEGIRKEKNKIPDSLRSSGSAEDQSLSHPSKDADQEREKSFSANQPLRPRDADQEKNNKESWALRKNTSTSSAAKTWWTEKGQAQFEQFWKAYPKKKNYGAVETAWKKLHPDDALFEKMMRTLELAKQSKEWTNEDGQYIPYPAKWLEVQGWRNEYAPRKKERKFVK